MFVFVDTTYQAPVSVFVDSNADPSLQELQKKLKKSRLQDSLRGRIANRPGPLELVEGNILQTDPHLKDAIIGTV